MWENHPIRGGSDLPGLALGGFPAQDRLHGRQGESTANFFKQYFGVLLRGDGLFSVSIRPCGQRAMAIDPIIFFLFKAYPTTATYYKGQVRLVMLSSTCGISNITTEYSTLTLG